MSQNPMLHPKPAEPAGARNCAHQSRISETFSPRKLDAVIVLMNLRDIRWSKPRLSPFVTDVEKVRRLEIRSTMYCRIHGHCCPLLKRSGEL